MNIKEIDEKLAIAGRRTSFFTPEQARELLGDEWADANPAALGTFSTGAIINALLDMRLELTTPEEVTHDSSESIQEELDSLTGSDIGIS